MEIKFFTFNRRANGDITATNGPVVVRFEPTAAGIKYSTAGSNVTQDWQFLPRVALAAARWHRRHNRDWR